MSESQGFSAPDSTDLNGQPQYAGFWWRFLACFIDGIIIQVGTFLVLLVPAIILSLTLVFSGTSNGVIDKIADFFGTGIGILISLLYYVRMESSAKQATLGKLICRLKVVSKEGERLSWRKATIRYVARGLHTCIFAIVSLLLITVLGLGLILTGASADSLPKMLSASDPNALMTISGIVILALIGVCAGSIVGYLPALWTPKKQTLHDLIAGTVVVKKD